MKRETKEPLSRLDSLKVGRGGTALLGEAYCDNAKIELDYRESIRALEQYPFWNAGLHSYLPTDGLWAPQRRAIALSLAYLSSQRLTHKPLPDSMRESALIKMPTGSGKTGVIATLACCTPKVRRTIILTPRAALVEQMMKDLSWRFWSRFDYCYIGTALEHRSSQDPNMREKVDHEPVTSIDRLNEQGYLRIWKGRQKERQIIVGTFNALHAVLGIEPPAHRSMQGSKSREPAAVLHECKKDLNDRKGVENFRTLLRDTDLLIVDEGHYEPAFSWAQCVESLNVPTIIFSATKAKNAEANVSAANLETVGRQASASLAFIGSSRTPLAFPTHWPKQIKIKNRKSKKLIKIVDRIHSRRATTPLEAHSQVVAALADPTYRREVWVVTTGLLSKEQAKTALGGTVRQRGALQFAYYLADLRTTFGRAGVTLKIFTAG